MKITTEQAIIKFRKKHGDLYDYSLVDYKTAKTKVNVICREHGKFAVTPNNHLSGHGCPKCNNKGFSKEERLSLFLLNAKQLHGENYDYSLVRYVTPKSKIMIICNTHGKFESTIFNHISNKTGCPKCSKESYSQKTFLPVDKFINKAIKMHGRIYDYSKVEYNGAHKKVTIICHKHGDFQVTPVNHWSNGVGCPSCFNSNPSKGETKIYNWLTENNIYFEHQKTFDGLYYKSKKGRLKFDFFIPDANLLIEYDGEYHYKPISFSKSITGKEQLALTKIRDKLKDDYAKNHGISLLRIRYDEDIITKLKTTLLP